MDIHADSKATRSVSSCWRLAAVAGALCILGIGSAGPARASGESDRDDDGGHAIHVLSSKPHLVSGGDVLIGVDAGEDARALRLDLNGQDVTATLQHGPRHGDLQVLIGGLKLGRNVLSLSAHGRPLDRVELVDYPITGPITSGPHITPFICQTQEFVLPDGSKLGPPLDADCTAPTVIQYLYLPAGGSSALPPAGR